MNKKKQFDGEKLKAKLQGLEEALRLFRQDEPSAEEENEKYTKPCPFDESVPCIQYPREECDDTLCEECEIRIKAQSEEYKRLLIFIEEQMAHWENLYRGHIPDESVIKSWIESCDFALEDLKVLEYLKGGSEND